MTDPAHPHDAAATHGSFSQAHLRLYFHDLLLDAEALAEMRANGWPFGRKEFADNCTQLRALRKQLADLDATTATRLRFLLDEQTAFDQIDRLRQTVVRSRDELARESHNASQRARYHRHRDAERAATERRSAYGLRRAADRANVVAVRLQEALLSDGDGDHRLVWAHLAPAGATCRTPTRSVRSVRPCVPLDPCGPTNPGPRRDRHGNPC